ncbi:MAG: TRAP transporter large permease [Clostridiaceae bacterium]|nr:TRAP transporter large permease [Clostridiaceae bacterium]MCI9483512.1 TRAP transporter large permease [Clostridiaceae bacterium]
MVVFILITLLLLLFLGLPVAHAIGIEAMLYMLKNGIALSAIPQKFYSGIDSFTLLAIPGFMLAGNLMNNGGITERIIDFCKRLLGRIRGSLGVANVVASMLFGGISGSAVGDTASIGAILIPAMTKEGYTAEFSVGVTAASSCLAPVIPPSIAMIVVGGCCSLSVGKLFIAGAIPGILLGLGQCGVALFIAYKNGYPRGIRCTIKEKCAAFFDSFWALLMVVIILVGILSGLVTPTEASMIAAVYAFLVGKFIYKDLKLSMLPDIVINSMTQTAQCLVINGFAAGFAWLLARDQIPGKIASMLLSVSANKWVILLLINLLLIFVGMFMETLSSLMILMPILLPIATQIGVSPIQFAVMCVVNLTLGLATPPVGVCLSLASSIGEISLSKGTKGILPFYLVGLLTLLLIAVFPPLTLWLPSLF